MRGFWTFLGKEMRDIQRTWRIWVLPLIAIGMGALGPVIAKITPALLESVASSQPGVVFQIPDPTTVDAYRQWLGDLGQTVLIAVIISMAGAVAAERKNGTAVLVLTKPISRHAFVLAKIASNLVVLTVSTIAGTFACWLGTTILFANEHAWRLVQATALWFALAAAFVAIMTLLSVVVKSSAGAAGVGFGVYIAVAIASAWGPARDYSLAGLLTAGDRILTGESVEAGWPVLTAMAVTLIAAWAATAVFARAEL